jgi:hypothetical protein
MGVLAWLDTSDNARRSALEILDRFREADTLDEIGVGAVRDGIANVLFPGTSVLHTRARYLLFVPWVYRKLEDDGVGSRDVAARARHQQARLRDALVNGSAGHGIIGLFVGAEVRVLPANAYWSALRAFGISRYDGPLERYHRSFDSLREASRQPQGEPSGDWGRGAWTPTLPKAPEDLWDSATFELTRDEAGLLRDHVASRARDSLLAYLLQHPEALADDARVDRLPLADATPELRTTIGLAATFADLVHGARVLYGLRVAELVEEGEAIRAWEDHLEKWGEEFASDIDRFASLDWPAFWRMVSQGNRRIPDGARRFCQEWCRIACETRGAVATDAARSLIERREARLKGPLARLKPENHRRRDQWGSGEPGRLDYRWGTVRVIVRDIVDGLDASEDVVDARS